MVRSARIRITVSDSRSIMSMHVGKHEILAMQSLHTYIRYHDTKGIKFRKRLASSRKELKNFEHIHTSFATCPGFLGAAIQPMSEFCGIEGTSRPFPLLVLVHSHFLVSCLVDELYQLPRTVPHCPALSCTVHSVHAKNVSRRATHLPH